MSYVSEALVQKVDLRQDVFIRRNKGIDRYRTDFSQGFFYSPKFLVKKYTIWFKDPCDEILQMSLFGVNGSTDNASGSDQNLI